MAKDVYKQNKKGLRLYLKTLIYGKVEVFSTKIKKASFLNETFSFGCGGRTWTYDLRVMSPTSYQLLHPATYIFII